jgi:hypothetical protein
MKIRSASWCLVVGSAAVAAGTGAKTQTASHATQERPDSEKQQTLIRSSDGAAQVN